MKIKLTLEMTDETGRTEVMVLLKELEKGNTLVRWLSNYAVNQLNLMYQFRRTEKKIS